MRDHGAIAQGMANSETGGCAMKVCPTVKRVMRDDETNSETGL